MATSIIVFRFLRYFSALHGQPGCPANDNSPPPAAEMDPPPKQIAA